MTAVRILRIITRLNVGGPALHVSILTAGLDPARFETLLVAGRVGPAEGNMLQLGRTPAAVTPVVVPSLGRSIGLFRDLQAFWSVARLARAYRPAIVHTHLAKAGFIGRIAAKLCGARVVVHTYHGTVFHGYFGRRESSLYLRIERLLARLTTRLVAVTDSQRDDLVRLGVAPAAKIAVVPLGLKLAPLRAAVDPVVSRAAFGIDPADAVVGTVARLVAIKDLGTFLRGIALLAARRPDLTALIVGDGEERTALERLARDLGIAGRCRFAGWRADLPQVYGAMDVMALTSLNEGSPVSLIEAMAAGLPVVATDVGGVPDVVADGQTGFLVPPRDPGALADTLGRCLALPDRGRGMGAAGRERAFARHDAGRLITDMEELYSSLLDAGAE